MIDYDTLAQLSSEEVTLLWSGILDHGGQLFHHELCDGTPENGRYAMRALSPAQEAEEARWLPLYREHSGSDSSMFYAAYNARENPIDYASLPIVAWFES